MFRYRCFLVDSVVPRYGIIFDCPVVLFSVFSIHLSRGFFWMFVIDVFLVDSVVSRYGVIFNCPLIVLFVIP